jgi:hypothetical protein
MTAATMTATLEPTGVIEGSLGYPASGIPPDLYVCAINVSTDQEFCTHERLTDPRFLYDVGYELTVPAGSYQVYATLPNGLARGYYTELAKCGGGPECQSHDILTVTVAPDKRLTQVDPIDFYGPWQPTATP